MSDLIENITDLDFKEKVLDESGVVLIDVWAPWCQPCKMISPVLEQLSEERKGHLKIVKANADESVKEILSRHEIRGIPALILYKNGKMVGRHVGLLDKNQLNEFINMNT